MTTFQRQIIWFWQSRWVVMLTETSQGQREIECGLLTSKPLSDGPIRTTGRIVGTTSYMATCSPCSRKSTHAWDQCLYYNAHFMFQTLKLGFWQTKSWSRSCCNIRGNKNHPAFCMNSEGKTAEARSREISGEFLHKAEQTRHDSKIPPEQSASSCDSQFFFLKKMQVIHQIKCLAMFLLDIKYDKY